jgi:PleD family two-component response regulator
VAQCLSTDTDLQEARMRAEVMLLEAKQLGRNRVRYHASRNVPNATPSSSLV